MGGLFLWAITALMPGIAGAQDEDAKKVYDARCSLCHGIDGTGNGPAGSSLQPPPTNFTSPDYWKSATPERIKSSIVEGKPGTAMIPFAAVLKPEEIDAVVDYLRGFAPKQ
jgi:high-affinity iron transporter